MGPAFGFCMRFSIVGQVERASSNNKATNLQKPRGNKKKKKNKPADTMSGRNLEETKKKKQKKNKPVDTSSGSAEHGLCSFVFFCLFWFPRGFCHQRQCLAPQNLRILLALFFAPGGHD